MNDAFIKHFIVYCCTPKTLFNHVGGGGSLLKHLQCAASTWMVQRLPQYNGASALTTHQLQMERRESHRANQVDAHTTHQLQVERRERHRVNQVYALTTHQLQVERRESVTYIGRNSTGSRRHQKGEGS